VTWDGKEWSVGDNLYTADMQIIRPLQDKVAAAYAKEKRVEPRDCAAELKAAE